MSLFLFGALEAISVIGTVGQSTYESATQSENLRRAIEQTRATTANLKTKWDNIITQQISLTAEVRQSILDDLDNIARIKAQTELSKERFEKEFQAIQLAGVQLVVVIFCLLLLKRSGILDYIDALVLEAILGPAS